MRLPRLPVWLIAIPVIVACMVGLILTWREPDLLVGLLKTAVTAGVGVGLWEGGKKLRPKKVAS